LETWRIDWNRLGPGQIEVGWACAADFLEWVRITNDGGLTAAFFGSGACCTVNNSAELVSGGRYQRVTPIRRLGDAASEQCPE